MTRLISRIRALVRPKPRAVPTDLPPEKAAILRRNLRAILLSKQSLTNHR